MHSYETPSARNLIKIDFSAALDFHLYAYFKHAKIEIF